MPEEDDQAPMEGPVAKAAVRQVERAIAALNGQYAASQRAFRIEHLAGGYRVMTLAAYAPILAAFHKRQTSSKLSRAAVETLAIIAYKQPLTKAELEAIRGVSCGEVLKTLLEKRLVTVKGRAEELGRPLLYGTTTDFLKLFGLASIKDLPSPTELKLST
jgi:segregation and condensation protein B